MEYIGRYKNQGFFLLVKQKPPEVDDYVLDPPFRFHPPWYPGLNSTHFYRVYAFITLIVVALLRTIASDMKTLTRFLLIFLFAF